MADMDFIQFISDNSTLGAQEKLDMLNDFCFAFGFSGTTQQQKQYANERITKFIREAVHRARRQVVQISELQLVDGTVVLP